MADKEIDCLDPTHRLIVFINNEFDDWATLDQGVNLVVMTSEGFELLADEDSEGEGEGELEGEGDLATYDLATYDLSDPEDLRRLADLIEKRQARKVKVKP